MRSLREYIIENESAIILAMSKKELSNRNKEFIKEYNKKSEEEKVQFLAQELKKFLPLGKKKYTAFNTFLKGAGISVATINDAKVITNTELGRKNASASSSFLEGYNKRKTYEEKLQYTIEAFRAKKEYADKVGSRTIYNSFTTKIAGKIDEKIRLEAMSEVNDKLDRSGLNLIFMNLEELKTDEEKIEYLVKVFRERLKKNPKGYAKFVADFKGKIDESIRLRAMNILSVERGAENQNLGMGAEKDLHGLTPKNEIGIRTNVGIRLKDDDEVKSKSVRIIGAEDSTLRKSRLKDLRDAISEGNERKILYEFIRLLKGTNYLKNDIVFQRTFPSNKNVFIEVKNVRYSGGKTEKALEGMPQHFDKIPFSTFIDLGKGEKTNEALKNIIDRNKDSINNKLDTVVKNQLRNSEKYGSRIMLAIHDIKADKDNIFWVNLRKKTDDIRFFLEPDKSGIKAYISVSNLTKEDLLPRKKIKDSLKDEVDFNLLSLLEELMNYK